MLRRDNGIIFPFFLGEGGFSATPDTLRSRGGRFDRAATGALD
jgi:hypothetical protein